jgi:type IV pilus assembly protein PilX
MATSGATSTPIWQSLAWDSGHTRQYGQYTGATALSSVAAQPTYIVEMLPGLPPGVGNSVNLGSAQAQQTMAFRITARGVGLKPSTVVMLQSVYIKQ